MNLSFKNKATPTSIRDWLVVILLAGAPFSFNPSLSLPVEGFVSFRIGLYQLLIVAFVAVMLPKVWDQKKKFLYDYSVAVPSIVLLLLLLFSPFRSLDFSRSALLSGSILLLLMLLVSGWAYGQTFRAAFQQKAVKATITAGALVGLFAVIQLVVNTFAEKSLGLCANCGAAVFGFPRVNGFAAEPQFYASTLIPALLLIIVLYHQTRSRKYISLFGFLVFVLFITLSRGGYVAAAAGMIFLAASLLLKGFLDWRRLFELGMCAVIAILLGISALSLSAALRHDTTPDIVTTTTATIIEHSTGGVIDLPYNDQKNVPSPVQPEQAFESPGVIEASHEDRQSAASLGLRWWRQNTQTMITGLGAGNLGSFAYNQDLSLPLSFTIYMQYIFVLVEFGVLGLISFIALLLTAIKRAFVRLSPKASTFEIALASIIFAFSVHYIFFGTYINVPYVWLYTGLALGLRFKK